MISFASSAMMALPTVTTINARKTMSAVLDDPLLRVEFHLVLLPLQLGRDGEHVRGVLQAHLVVGRELVFVGHEEGVKRTSIHTVTCGQAQGREGVVVFDSHVHYAVVADLFDFDLSNRQVDVPIVDVELVGVFGRIVVELYVPHLSELDRPATEDVDMVTSKSVRRLLGIDCGNNPKSCVD